MNQERVENVIIIGGGPAGLAAAVYTSRAALTPLMFSGAPYGGQLMLTSDVENYPGFTSILGPELIEKMREQVRHFGTTIIDQNVLKVDFSKKPFGIHGEKEYFAKSVIIATGAQALWLGLDSEQRLRGKGVSACATCDGFFFKEKIVGVVGGGDSALEEALFLTKFASRVHVFHRRDSFRASKIMQERVLKHDKIQVHWNTEVTEVLGNLHVEGVKLEIRNPKSEIRNFPLSGLFLAIGHKPDTELFKGQVELDEKGYIITSAIHALVNIKDQMSNSKKNFDYKYQTATSVQGIFAGGDSVDHVYRQAGTAVGMGIAAALDAERWLETSTA